MDLKGMGYDVRNWLDFAKNLNQWQAYVRAGMNLQVT